MQYTPCEVDLAERFDDIVGVTLFEERQIEHIVLWVSEESLNYVLTKPIHGSQKVLKTDEAQKLQEKYPQFSTGQFLSIDCVPNYELTRVLCSYGNNLIVISPTSIQNEIFTQIEKMYGTYSCLRT